MTIKNRYRRIKKNKDAKVLLENFFSLTILQIAGYAFPLITLPYLARVIGVEKFGEIAFSMAILGYFQTIVDYGFNYTATRDIAKNRENLKIVSNIYSSVMWARVGLMFLSILLLTLLIALIPRLFEMRVILLATFLIIPGFTIFPTWLFQGLERMKYITILNLMAKLIFTLLVFVFIKEQSDYFLQPIFTAIGFFFSGLIAMYVINGYGIKLHKPSISAISHTIKHSTDVFINQLFPNLYKSFSILLLGFFGGSYANGILDAGNRFPIVAQHLLNVISRSFFPYLSRNIEKHNFYSILTFSSSVAMALALFVFAPKIISIIFTDSFINAVPVLRILAISIIFISLTNIYGTNYMIIQGHAKILRNITIVSSVIGFLIAWPLVYYYHYIGAAIAIASGRGIMAFVIFFYARRIKSRSIVANKAGFNR